MIEKFTLLPHEKNSPLWRRFEDFMNARLAIHRTQNDGDKDPIKTAHLRGRIAEAKFVLTLGNDPAPRQD